MKRFLGPSNRLIVAAAILAAVLLNGAFCYWFVQSNVTALTAQRAAFRLHDAHVEAKLCSTFGSLYADQPPAGDPATNPSRAYLQELHTRLGEVLPDLGCPGG